MSASNEIPLTMTVEDMAKLLNIGRNSAYNLVHCGAIKSIRIGRQIRISRSALLEYLAIPTT